MSSLRNSVPSRSYRERPQPLSRADKHPLLEKRRDYRLRARDHAAKQAHLKQLRARAAERNPDEFAFGMLGRTAGRTARGKANTGGLMADEEEGGRGEKAGHGLSSAAVKLLKTQDAGLLRTMRARVRREREGLEERLVVGEEGMGVLGAEGQGRHLVFVEGVEEQRGFDPVGHFGTDARGLQRAYNRPRRGEGERGDDEDGDREGGVVLRKGKDKDKQRAKLAALRAQEGEIAAAERELELQRARMNGDVGGVNKNGVRWKPRGRKR